VFALISVPITLFIHQPFFPTSQRAILLLSVFAIYYVSALSALQAILLFVVKPSGALRLFPSAPGLIFGLSTGLLLTVVYVGGFSLALVTGALDKEMETYRAEQEPSRPDDYFRQTDAPDDHLGAPPNPGLFVAEDLVSINFGEAAKGSVAVVDVNGDGFFDLAATDADGAFSVWINRGGVLKKADHFIADLADETIGVFSFVDYDRDGLMDLFLAQTVKSAQSEFEKTVLKQLIWYPTRKPATTGRLFRQIKAGQWKDVTAQAFSDGAPTQFRKTEPILWFDFNGDGRLDFVWSGYPHPRGGGQSLYIQNPDGTFSDKIKETLRWSSNGVYAEGSDVADFDGDGDIDVFAYGFLFRNDNGVYVQVCGDQMPGVYCDAEARNEEGALFEDIDGDGTLDFVLSYHGAGGIIPKYYLQLFRGQPSEPGKLKRDTAYERQFYGFNTYLRGKDFDLNGRPDVLTNDPGRLLTYYRDKWVDLLPAIGAQSAGDLWPLGWLDIDEDGDWDFLAFRISDEKPILFRNHLNPGRFMKISVVGPGGVENQYGATVQISLPDDKKAIASYRPMGGYQGTTDPRLVYPLRPEHEYMIKACFPSLKGQPSANVKQASAHIEVVNVSDRCATYNLTASKGATRLDVTLIAGSGNLKNTVQ